MDTQPRILEVLKRGYRWTVLVIAGICATLMASNGAFAEEHTRPTYPNAVSFEVFGRGLLYTLQFDRVVNDDIVAGFGFGSVATRYKDTDTDTGQTALMVPVYANYYFIKKGSTPFATLGATLVANSGDVKNYKSSLGNLEFTSNPVIPTFGVGYEARTDQGFMFRLTGYGMFAKSFVPWFGFNFGFAF